MGGIYQFLGLSVGCVQQAMSVEDRQRAYACDITYVTANEAGFDYLQYVSEYLNRIELERNAERKAALIRDLRSNLDRRTRSLVTIAILAALGREELALHLRASHNIGVDPHEIAEVLLHVAVYAGVPAANTAFAMAKKELARQAAASEEGDSAKTSQEGV